MTLSSLPESVIQPLLQRLQRKATESLQPLAEYVVSTWMNGTTWKPQTELRLRKQSGLNGRAPGHGPIPMYILIQLLHKEARLANRPAVPSCFP